MTWETWEGSAKLTGYGAAVSDIYPIRGERVDDATEERVYFEISEPTEISGPLDSTMYKQDLKLQVTAEPSRVQELAMETALDEADMISFVTNRRVQVSLGGLTNSSPQAGQAEGQSMLFIRRFKGPEEPTIADVHLLAHITAQVGDTVNDRGRRIIRALRWLRRARLADDEVEEFASMLMGYDGLKTLLPQPPVQTEGKKKGGQKKPVSKPGINAILKNWAVRECGITPEDWKQVWDLRNDLFHGDLTENADTRSKLAGAIPNLRLALGLALKHVLQLPESAPPHLGLPPFVITDLQITASPPIKLAPDPAPFKPYDEVPDLPET